MDLWNERRRDIAEKYLERLKVCQTIILPQVPEWAEVVWHQFVIRHSYREAFQQALSTKGIDTMIHYPVPPHLQKAYTAFSNGDFHLPLTELLAEQVLSLPVGPHLSSTDQDEIVRVIRESDSIS